MPLPVLVFLAEFEGEAGHRSRFNVGRIGETEEGAIFAGRVAVVSAKGSKVRNYHRAALHFLHDNEISFRSPDCTAPKSPEGYCFRQLRCREIHQGATGKISTDTLREENSDSIILLTAL